MIRSKTDGDEVLYMDEVHEDGYEETSRPTQSAKAHAMPTIRSRVGSLTETKLPEIPHTTFATELNDLSEIDGKQPIGFNDVLLPGGPNNNRDDSRDFFPEAAPSQVTPDVNLYQHKKTVAQGMMDLALLSANANQMRYVLQTDGQHPYFYPSLIMIGTSLLLQIAVGIGLIWNSRYNVKEHEQMCKANKANNWTVIGIFLVTILNVFISSFGVVDQTSSSTTSTVVVA
ncbi:PREDICTED: ninjurin-1-like [Dinoponera quadriceps]|uniref:Ninjurin-1-like n=1 Tax=Dinoponera quadriceps TaxID=609295 RepID=A0A6P3X894_DINQU|nr:PREDICTED: ninjurin-1-like [Dinoponera quadriceps]